MAPNLFLCSYIDQLNLILQTLGTPDESTLDRVGSERACQYIRSLPRSEKVPFAELFPNAEPSGKHCRMVNGNHVSRRSHCIAP